MCCVSVICLFQLNWFISGFRSLRPVRWEGPESKVHCPYSSPKFLIRQTISPLSVSVVASSHFYFSSLLRLLSPEGPPMQLLRSSPTLISSYHPCKSNTASAVAPTARSPTPQSAGSPPTLQRTPNRERSSSTA